MKLYDYHQAPNPRRVRIFMAEKGIDIPIEEVDLATRAQLEDFTKLNPMAEVPALELDDGTILTESLAICTYLEGLHPEPNLLGRDPQEKGIISMWDRRIELAGFMGVAEAFRNSNPAFEDRSVTGQTNFAQIPELVDRGRARAEDCLNMLNDQLADNAYITGDRFTIADITALVLAGFGRWIKLDATEGRPHLQRWLEDVSARPSADA